MAIPKITLSAGTFPKEGTVGTYLITLDSAAPAGGLVVNFNTIGSTATFLTDYNLFAGTNITAVTANSFTIAAGQTTANLNVRVFGDTFVESNETVNLNLVAGTGYQQINNTTSFSKVDYITGVAPNGVAVADINRDGKLDLVTANWVNNTVSILLRNATNTGFDAKVDFATGKQPYSVSIADFNGDGKPDLAVANFTSNTVSVLLRNATNTGFNPKIDYTTGNGTTFVSAGDFNNDGKSDLIIANQNANSVSVLLRNAANTGFNTKVNYATGSVPQSVRVGDFNGDGKLDFVVGNAASNTVSVFVRNAANTGFDAKVNYATGVNPLVSVGDFNGDGKLDIATANAGSNTVSVLLRNAANNGFDAKTDYVVGSSPHSISVADFNNDGKLDLAVTNQGSNTVSLLLRNSLNTGFNSQLQYATGSRPSFGGVGDFNKDGKVDLVVTNSGTNTVSVFSNTSSSSATLTIVDNKPPVLTGSQAVLANGTEDMAYRILAGNLLQGFSDADSALSVTNLTATNGSLTAISGGWRFTPTANYNGVVALNYFVTDGAALISATRSFVLAAVNDAATATNLSTAESYIEDSALNLTDIFISDVDSVNVTATLTLSNAAAGSLKVASSGAVYNAGVWTATGTKGSVNMLLADLIFVPTTNFNGNFTISTSVSDGVAAAITGSKSFTGVAVNDAPTATNLSKAESYTEDTALNLTNIVISDVDSANVTARLTLSNAAAGSLNIATSGAVTSTYSAGVWTATGVKASVNALLADLTFTPTTNFNGNFTIATSVSDGVAAAITGSKSFTGVAVNDAPTATNLSTAEIYMEDMPLDFFSDIVITDIDSANVTAKLTLSNAAAGSLNVATSGGAVTSTYSAGVWTATGAKASVNALLADLTFTPATNFNGNFSIATSVSDGVAAAVTGSKFFNGSAEYDAPTATNLSTAETYTEDTPLNLTDIVISDVDNVNVIATLTLSNAAAGSLNVATSGDAISIYSAGVWTATGGAASISALLADLTFTPAANFNGNFTIATSVSDVTADGIGTVITGSKTFTGVAINDYPVLSGTQAVLPMTPEGYPPYTISSSMLLEGFSDVDSDTLSVANLTVSSGTVQENTVMGGWTVFQDENFCGNVNLTYNVIDGKGGSVAATGSIRYEAVNDPAIFGLGGGSVNFTKAGAAVVLDNDITLTDVDFDFDIYNSNYSAYLNYAELKLERQGGANSDDVFSSAAVSDGNIVISNINIGLFSQLNGTLWIYFNQNATQALVNQALHQIKYSNSSNTPPASVQIDWTFSDGVGVGPNSFTTNTTTVNIIDPLISTTPTAGNDSLTGTAGNDTIDGLAGADTMTGGLGNDAYFVDNTGDIVTETSTLATEIDTVNSSITYTLPANVENLVLTGTATINGIGNSLNNVFTGSSGVNNFWGKAGDDTYIVNKITYVGENLNEGIDTVMSSVSYALNDNVENLTLTGTASIDGVGNSSDNVFTGNAGVNNFWGKAGDDTYIVNKATYVGENLNEGIDTVMSSVTYGLNDNVENLTLTGTANIDGVGNSLDNVFTGNKGINNFFGKAGNDTYYVNKPTHVGENVNEGTDTVFSSANYALNDNVENLTLTGKAYAAVGNDLDNVLTGNLYDNVLNGKGGADTLIGGLGNDIYIVDDSNTVVVEASKIATEIDTVNSSITYTLGVNLENIILTASAAVDGIGNIRDNTLTGNVAANKLSGNGGNDTLMGGQGQDTLTGGVGADSFKFTSVNQTGVTVATCDTITDFKTTDADKIDLSAIDANTVIAGDDAFVSVSVGNTFSGLFANTGELYFDQLSRILYGNNDSDTAADFSILLTGVATLSATDFVL
jgi:trimeric autotransporter adhesin